ncbi:glycosyltransferase family 61 protein [Celeribacter sp.]|uniref:glycosyltransferase family 61 protein n=1 Tax=Celeribacter sp. TaxID=1890673 RepID=UPI003A8E024B
MHALTIAPFTVPEHWLITPASHFVDRFVPDCEQILLPAKQVEGGTLTLSRGPLPAPVPASRTARLLKRAKSEPAPKGDVIDLRRDAPQNWAHFLNNHLPLTFKICALMEIDPADVTLLVPPNTPAYIKAAADLLGITLLASDAHFQGEGLLYDLTPWTGLRPERHLWVDCNEVRNRTRTVARNTRPDGIPLPQKAFLSRRDTRTLENETEVSDWLRTKGFVKLYVEDLSAADQFRLFNTAHEIVAIHGAALASLLYTHANTRPKRLIELMPCGHMTDVYRVMAAQLGIGWTGVRGRIKPNYVTPAYDLSQPFLSQSLDSFSIDIAALNRALDLAPTLTDRAR